MSTCAVVFSYEHKPKGNAHHKTLVR